MKISDEAVEAALFKVESIHHIHGDQCLCGFKSAVSRDRTKHIMEVTLEAVAPFIAARAWDRAASSIVDEHGNPIIPDSNTNPYRSQA